MTENATLSTFTDVFSEDRDSQPISLSAESNYFTNDHEEDKNTHETSIRPLKNTGKHGDFRSVDEIDEKYRAVFSYQYFNLIQSKIIDDAIYSDKSIVVCAPTGSGKTVVFELAIVQLLMDIEDKKYTGDFKIIYMAPVKAVCTERLTEWYPKFTRLGLLCIEVTGDTNVDFNQLKPYRIIITTPEKWDMLTRRWTDYRSLVEVVKLFLIDEVHILNDEARGPVLEAVVSRMKTIEASSQSAYRIEQLQKQYNHQTTNKVVNEPPRIRFVAVSATVSNPEDVAAWLGTGDRPAVYHRYGDECRPVRLHRVVEGYPCPEGTSIFKFDILLNYKLWPVIQKYYNGKPTLIFCNTRKSVTLTAEALAREITVTVNPEQKAKLSALASIIKNKKLQMLVLSGVGCHHAGLLYEERFSIEQAFRNRDLPILITTTTLAMGVNLPAHLVIIKNTQQYVNGAYQEYSISTILQMVGRAGRPQFDTEATAVIMTRSQDKYRYQSLIGGGEPLQSYLHKRLPENVNSEAALNTVNDIAQCVQWLRSTFLYIRAAKDPKRYLNLPSNAPQHLISKKIEELCLKAMNGLASAGLLSMDEASCIESTEAGRLMSIYYLDFDTMKTIMKIEGTENLQEILWIICNSHELSDIPLRVDERRCLNMLNRNNSASTIRFPMKGKIISREMKANCMIQAVLGCLPINEPSLNQESMKIMRIADRVCKCLVSYLTRPSLLTNKPKFLSAILNSIIISKCVYAHLWENSPYLSKQLKGIGPTFSTLLATAGKTTFMQLEEAHPRDLERIMNKGPPAGNVLHKQVTLLPKYQLSMSPIDEKTVKIELLLINCCYLRDNIDQLTAGDNHKSYLVIGDSENHVLMLFAFKDKDFMGLYDGQITHTITREHRFEHKLFAHCISSTYVGIDCQCEYLFKDLDDNGKSKRAQSNSNLTPNTKATAKTATKRKSSESVPTKEKKKKDNTLISKYLKKAEQLHTPSPSRLIQTEVNNYFVNTKKHKIGDESLLQDVVETNIDNFDDEIEVNVDDDQFNNLLHEIESEISKSTKEKTTITKRPEFNKYNVNSTYMPVIHKEPYKYDNNNKKKSNNFKFIELLERNVDFSDDDEIINDNLNAGFSNAIKSNIDKFLDKTKNKQSSSAYLLLEKEMLEINDEKTLKYTNNNRISLSYQEPCDKNDKSKDIFDTNDKIQIIKPPRTFADFSTVGFNESSKQNYNNIHHVIDDENNDIVLRNENIEIDDVPDQDNESNNAGCIDNMKCNMIRPMNSYTDLEIYKTRINPIELNSDHNNSHIDNNDFMVDIFKRDNNTSDMELNKYSEDKHENVFKKYNDIVNNDSVSNNADHIDNVKCDLKHPENSYTDTIKQYDDVIQHVIEDENNDINQANKSVEINEGVDLNKEIEKADHIDYMNYDLRSPENSYTDVDIYKASNKQKELVNDFYNTDIDKRENMVTIFRHMKNASVMDLNINIKKDSYETVSRKEIENPAIARNNISQGIALTNLDKDISIDDDEASDNFISKRSALSKICNQTSNKLQDMVPYHTTLCISNTGSNNEALYLKQATKPSNSMFLAHMNDLTSNTIKQIIKSKVMSNLNQPYKKDEFISANCQDLHSKQNYQVCDFSESMPSDKDIIKSTKTCETDINANDSFDIDTDVTVTNSYSATKINVWQNNRVKIIEKMSVNVNVSQTRQKIENDSQTDTHEPTAKVITKETNMEQSNTVTKRNNTNVMDESNALKIVPDIANKKQEIVAEKCEAKITEPKSLEDILKKYSNIFRNNCSQQTLEDQVPDKKIDESNQSKPKRPFKIKDIHRIDTSIPISLLNISQSNNNDQTITKPVVLIKPACLNNFELGQTIKRTDENQHLLCAQPNTQVSNIIEQLSEPEYISPDVELNLELDNFETINQEPSLDPKAVLENYGDVLEPPPQFRDETYSPISDNCQSKNEYQHGNFACPNFRITSPTNYNTETNKDIETWELDVEEISAPNNISPYDNTFKRRSKRNENNASPDFRITSAINRNTESNKDIQTWELNNVEDKSAPNNISAYENIFKRRSILNNFKYQPKYQCSNVRKSNYK